MGRQRVRDRERSLRRRRLRAAVVRQRGGALPAGCADSDRRPRLGQGDQARRHREPRLLQPGLWRRRRCRPHPEPVPGGVRTPYGDPALPLARGHGTCRCAARATGSAVLGGPCSAGDHGDPGGCDRPGRSGRSAACGGASHRRCLPPRRGLGWWPGLRQRDREGERRQPHRAERCRREAPGAGAAARLVAGVGHPDGRAGRRARCRCGECPQQPGPRDQRGPGRCSRGGVIHCADRDRR